MEVKKLLWKCPVPLTGLSYSPAFTVLPSRVCSLALSFEDENEGAEVSLVFDNVQAFKCSYLAACTAEAFNLAYGRLVDLGDTPWLRDILTNARASTCLSLRHLMICFDDGPCYEFICGGFREEQGSAPSG